MGHSKVWDLSMFNADKGITWNVEQVRLKQFSLLVNI